VCATLGTTACCSFDNIYELGEVSKRQGVYLHVDAAYAGNALICQEFCYLNEGIE
ncbi:tyrosine decarboxylase, partial [Biomphalaria pfeifferi]